jgi:hypothetical protein
LVATEIQSSQRSSFTILARLEIIGLKRGVLGRSERI